MGEAPSVLLAHGPTTGGIGRHVATLASGLRERGCTVAVAAVGRGPEAWRRLRAAAGGVDVIHAHGLTVGWWASLLPHRPPLVVTVHNVVLDDHVAGRRVGLLRLLQARLPARVDAVIATSAAVAAEVGPAVVIPPIGPALSPPARVTRTGRRVVTMGRLHRQKGIDVLVDAVPALRSRVPAVEVTIVGEGPAGAELAARIERLAVGAAVSLVGPTSDPAGVLAGADVVAVPSRWESGPLVVTEALELARPVVATPVGFVPELVDDGVTGRLVPIGDAPALADALAELLLDPVRAEALGAAGCERVARWLDRDAAVDAVLEVYASVRR